MNRLHRSLLAALPLAMLFLAGPAGAVAPIQPLSAPLSTLMNVKGGHGQWGHHRHGDRGLHRGWWIGRGNPHRWR